MRGVLACLVAVLAVAVCLSRTVGLIGGSAGFSEGGAPTAVARADQATPDPTGSVPSASIVTGDEFLAALDTYVATNPAADEGDYVELDGDVPSFDAQDATTDAFQSFSELDELGRCGTAFACLGPETLPSEERGDISEVHPSGWRHDDYDFIDGGSLYNRSHLIAFSLSGQNANERNLITGTRHMNAEVMEPIESMVRDYIQQTGNHVLYRVTPVFEGTELVARGVQMEALSMEDSGQGVSLNVYLRNIQPGVAIDYATGDNWASDAMGDESEPTTISYIVNTNTGKFHLPSCPSAAKIKEKNRLDSDATRDELIAQGYVPCKNCNP